MKVMLEIMSCATCPFVDLRKGSDTPLLPGCSVGVCLDVGSAPKQPFNKVPPKCPLQGHAINCTDAGLGLEASLRRVIIPEERIIIYKESREVER